MTIATQAAAHQIALLSAIALALCCGPGPDTTLCDPESCFSGCCQSNECIVAQSNAACGIAGTECSVCGSTQICSAGRCSEPESWSIRPLAASITLNDPRDLSAWDVDSSPPDVVVTMGCPLADGGIEWTETEEIESYAPTFSYGGCRAARQDVIDRGVIVDVSDRDFLIDDSIDAFTLIVPANAFPSQSTVATEQRDGGLVSLTISIASPQ